MQPVIRRPERRTDGRPAIGRAVARPARPTGAIAWHRVAWRSRRRPRSCARPRSKQSGECANRASRSSRRRGSASSGSTTVRFGLRHAVPRRGAATRRGRTGTVDRVVATAPDLAPEVADDLLRAAPAATAAKYQERLATAADALDRGRYDDARRMVQPVLRDLPDMAFGHEIAGLALYRHGAVAQGSSRAGGGTRARRHAQPPRRAGRLLPRPEALRHGRSSCGSSCARARRHRH